MAGEGQAGTGGVLSPHCHTGLVNDWLARERQTGLPLWRDHEKGRM